MKHIKKLMLTHHFCCDTLEARPLFKLDYQHDAHWMVGFGMCGEVILTGRNQRLQIQDARRRDLYSRMGSDASPGH